MPFSSSDQEAHVRSTVPTLLNNLCFFFFFLKGMIAYDFAIISIEAFLAKLIHVDYFLSVAYKMIKISLFKMMKNKTWDFSNAKHLKLSTSRIFFICEI